MVSSSGDWVADVGTLNDILNLLKEANSPDTQVQRRLAEAVGQLETLVHAPCYYCFIFVDCVQEEIDLRQRAGLLLKGSMASFIARISPVDSHLFSNTSSSVQQQQQQQQTLLSTEETYVLEYVKKNVMRAICDASHIIRSTAGTILTTIIRCQGADGFKDLLPFLFQLLDYPTEEISENAFHTMAMVVEDEIERNCYGSYSSQTIQSSSFLGFCDQYLLPKLFLLASPENSLSKRRNAMVCLNHFQRGGFFASDDIFSHFFPSYWKILGILAFDSSPAIRHLIVIGLVHVSIITPDIVFQNLESLMPFILQSLDPAQPYEIKLEAVDFISQIIKNRLSYDLLPKHFPTLLASLIENTRYSEWDYLQMDQKQLLDENSSAPDTAEDLAPQFHRGSRHNEVNEEDDRIDETESKSTWGTDWTLRKASAMIIDHLSTMYGETMLPFILPCIEARLQDKDWDIRETAVLAVGAIARGCLEGLEPFLPKVLEMLLRTCDDSKPILRSISLWTISRFSMWICPQPEILRIVTMTFLSHVLDRNKRVQEAACSAFACLEEEARDDLLPFLPIILETFHKAFCTFQTKNMVVLLDAIGTLAEALGNSIAIPMFYGKIVDPLLQRWSATDRDDPTIIVLFECISCIILAIQPGLPHYAPGILHQCLLLLRQTITEIEAIKESGSTAERAQREMLACALDVLSALCEALRNDMEVLIRSTDFFELLERCCKLNTVVVGSGVKQGCFALIGDLAEHTPNSISSRINIFVPEMIPFISTGPVSTSHNAAWAIGQIALHASADKGLTPYVETIATQLTRIMQSPTTHDSLSRNSCITLGRLALSYPEYIGPAMVSVFGIWCRAMERNVNDNEKFVAFRGLCNIINANQALAVEHMPALLDAICSLFITMPPCPPQPPQDGSAVSTTTTPPQFTGVPKETQCFLVNILSWLQASYPVEWEAATAQIKTGYRPTLDILVSSHLTG